MGGNGALVPTVLAVGSTVGRVANIWLLNENLDFAENSQICGRVAAATLSRSPRKALKLWILHIFFTPVSEANTEQSLQDFPGGIRKPAMVICLDLFEHSQAAKSHRQLHSVAFFMPFNPCHAFYQLHLCYTLDVLGNHHNFIESRTPESVPFLQHCYICWAVSLAGRR